MNEEIKRSYNTLVRPGFVDNIKRIGIDVVFSSAKGDYLYYDNDSKKVADFISGYGTGILGHNNPQLIELAKKELDNNIVFQGQRSIRGNAAFLAEKLNNIMKNITGNEYVFQFANSGAEANEIALKHSFMEKEQVDSKISRNMEEVAEFLPDLTDESIKADLLSKIEFNKNVLAEPKILIGMVDGFHGKTTGTLKISYATGLKFMLNYLNIETVYFDTDDITSVDKTVGMLERYIYEFTIENGKVSSSKKRYTPAIACFAEPILGDGGVIELSAEFAKKIRDTCDYFDIPLVFDEIQCGMGRTGKFFASEYLKVYADYYCMSKSLGGAITKNSVCAIIQKRFVPQFAFIHSSTFNEDDYSCGISCKVLDMLFANDEELIKLCAQKGLLIRDQLMEVQKKYPKFIIGIRGKGLMQGFVIDNSLSSNISQFTDIPYINIVEGFLFKHGFRVGTTLTSGAVIRLEPSVYVKDEVISELVTVLCKLGKLIQNEDYAQLVKEVVV